MSLVPNVTASAASANPTPIVASSADGLDVDFAFGGTTTDFGPVAGVSGSAPPAYDAIKIVGRLDKTFSLHRGDHLNPTLQVHALGIHMHAASSGIAVDSVSAHGAADIGSGEFLLTSNPSLDLLGVLGLSFSVSGLHSRADFSQVFGTNRGFVGGDASFGALRIGGALVGKTLTFSGDAAPNTVLFANSTVTVTLDKQTVTDLIGAGSDNAATPVHITTDAVDISLHNAPLFGTTVSGDIVIGQSSAGGSHCWDFLPHPD